MARSAQLVPAHAVLIIQAIAEQSQSCYDSANQTHRVLAKTPGKP